jgi:hypothetical protein
MMQMQQSLHRFKSKGFKATQLLHRFKIKGLKATQLLHHFKKKTFKAITITSLLKKNINAQLWLFMSSSEMVLREEHGWVSA